MAHSKAPWKMETETGHEWKGEVYVPYTKKTGWIDAADGTPVMQYGGCGSHEAEIVNPDDEALILAAPELLKQLIRLRLAFTIAVGELSPFAKQALAPVDEVIAAAGGEEQ